MNKTIYKQLDSRWSSLPYPTKDSSFGGTGCGCCACTHIAIEQPAKAAWTPKKLRKWMVEQGYAVAGQGTRWEGIDATLKHIGHKNVVWIKSNDPMTKAWEELDKGKRIGVLLVSNAKTPDGTYWTSSGHYVAFTKYTKDDKGRHWFYIKDSGGRNHDGWFCYETSIKNALPQMWIVKKLPVEKTVQDKICDYALKIAKDDSYIYVHWKKDDPKTKQCPICHNFPKGRYHGFYCTRFPVSMWHHGGGIAVKCDKAPNNGQIDRIYRASTDKEALKIARNLFGIKDIEVIRSKSGISQKKLKAGDICYYYGKGSTCQHAFLYIGNGYMIDANSLKDGIAKRKAMSCKVAVRYIGK